MTLLIISILVGWAGVAIVYDSTFMSSDVLSKTKVTDGSVDAIFAPRITLGESHGIMEKICR